VREIFFLVLSYLLAYLYKAVSIFIAKVVGRVFVRRVLDVTLSDVVENNFCTKLKTRGLLTFMVCPFVLVFLSFYI